MFYASSAGIISPMILFTSHYTFFGDDMGIAEKYGYNHPKRNRGDPRQHPDWDKWVGGGKDSCHEGYYCKWGKDGTECPDCPYWRVCIMQMYYYSVLCDYLRKIEVKQVKLDYFR